MCPCSMIHAHKAEHHVMSQAAGIFACWFACSSGDTWPSPAMFWAASSSGDTAVETDCG